MDIATIRDNLVDPDIPIADILRKAKVLAYRLDVSDFKQWVDRELDGYAGVEIELPDYRDFPTQNYGTFSGFGGSMVRNSPIPTVNLPEWVQKYVNRIELRQGVAALQDITSGDDQAVRLPWQAELIMAAGSIGQIMDDYALIEAWQLLGKNQIKGILDTIRNRLLTFMLELEDQFPEQAQSEQTLREIPKESSTQIFQTQVFGGQNTIASGQEISQQQVNLPAPNIAQGDLEALLEYARSLGIPNENVLELQEAVQEDELPDENGNLGARVSGWIGKMATKAAEGAWSTSAGQATKFLMKAALQYFGISV